MGAKVTKFLKRSGTADVDVLIQGSKWGGAVGHGPDLTFSFAGGNSVWKNGYEEAQGGVSYLTSAEKAAVRKILDVIDIYIDLDFKEVADNRKGSGDIRFAKTDIDGTGGRLAQAYYPDQRSPMNGDVWFDIYDPLDNFTATQNGAMAKYVAMHEILHALGLKHVREGAYQNFETIMNPTVYKDWFSSSRQWWSPMPNDIAALQFIYGEGKYNNGNTVYNQAYFNKTFGLQYPGSSRDLVTLWDSGGKDTIKLNVTDISLDHRVRDHDSGILVARGAVIENFKTDWYYAEVTGNAAANTITLGGDLRRQPMYDSHAMSYYSSIDTQGGNDVVKLARVYYNSYDPAVNNSNIADYAASANFIYLGKGNDIAYGSYFRDNLQGSDGSDILYGYEGNDILNGDGWVREAPNGKHIYEIKGDDTRYGGAGDDTLIGSVGRDMLYGEAGADTFMWDEAREISTKPNGSIDVIMDFNAGQGDKIWLPLSGQVVFRGTAGFTGTSKEIALAHNGDGSWNVLVDKDGDGDRDWVFKVHTAHGEMLTAADFNL